MRGVSERKVTLARIFLYHSLFYGLLRSLGYDRFPFTRFGHSTLKIKYRLSSSIWATALYCVPLKLSWALVSSCPISSQNI